jgi:hypothetical protein
MGIAVVAIHGSIKLLKYWQAVTGIIISNFHFVCKPREKRLSSKKLKTKTKFRGFSPLVNYTDRATETCLLS